MNRQERDSGTSGSPAEQDPRVLFAAERTLLAWIRTGLALMGFGFVVSRFGLFLREVVSQRIAGPHAVAPPAGGGTTLWTGVVLVWTGVVVTVLAAVNHVRTIRRLERGRPLVPRALSVATGLAVLLAAMGLGMAVYLVLVR